ncbi:hypothetical protein [Stackebrandtia nassauensis]|uniref:Uncharacterized protein n=1 Tax=Stackebrandtia nassauensis (strain DSM 44728 / CIP 108903 / NRRL B-16338 / NBRC 102104 / LLR-40K-21) TaxID=446470 RepID=D3PVZ5_STANL|nr:hypothetical protein [Stackebrandtia nassauensis]ADD45116.1 hypothetical protein Snas_5485 [Stackebrandtia nassauensis DSM 44728]
MTGPYQPPGGDFNSPFGPPDPNSPFTPAPGSQGGDSQGSKDEDESSPYEGVQYELETPGQPPMTPPPHSGPPSYGPTPPPPPAYAPQPTFMPSAPPKKSNNGLLIGGVIAGVVVLLLLVGIVIFAVALGSSDGSGDDADNAKYKIPSSPCSDVDLSPVTALASFSTEPTPSSSDYGSYGSASCSGGSLGDYATSTYGYFNMYIYTYDDVAGAESMYKTDTSGLSGCETSDLSGSWDQGTLGKGSSCYYGTSGSMTVLVIQDANLEAKISLDVTEDLSSGAEDAVKSVADSLLTASKA